jgi:hypothetical protein
MCIGAIGRIVVHNDPLPVHLQWWKWDGRTRRVQSTPARKSKGVLESASNDAENSAPCAKA